MNSEKMQGGREGPRTRYLIAIKCVRRVVLLTVTPGSYNVLVRGFPDPFLR